MTKRINKILWNGTEVPQAATRADGLDGLNLGELFIKNDPQEPGVYTRTTDGKVVLLGGGGSGTSELVDWNSIVNKPTKVSYFINDADYATTSDLDARIDALVNGAPQAYDTLKEIADVLAGNVNSISDILTALGNKADKATTLSGYGITDAYTITQIDNIVNGLSGNISTLQGYFTDGVANSALKLSDNGSYTAWGQTFFTNGKPKSLSGALTDVTDITSSGTITTNKIVIGNGTIEWDDTNKGFKVTGLYSTTYLSAKGANTNGGSSSGGGLIESLWKIGDLGKTFNTDANDTFNAYAINAIHNRVSVLEGKATNVSFTQSLTSGTQIGVISIDGASNNIYAPTIPTDDINKGVTAYGWGNHANVGYAMASALGGYLPLSGGTMNGTIILPNNTYIDSQDGATMFGIDANRGCLVGVSEHPLLLRSNGTSTINGNTLIHSGNIRGQSVDNADKLGGYYSYMYVKSLIDNTDDYLSPRSNAVFKTSWISGQGDFGTLIIPTWTGNNTNNYYLSELRFENGQYPKFRCSHNGVVETDWKTIAFTDSNVASATKLQTARSIWGQSFNGENDVSGNIHLNNSKVYWHNDSENYFIDNYYDYVNPPYMRYMGYDGHTFMTSSGDVMRIMSNGNVLIGKTTDNGAKLQLNGSINATSAITITFRGDGISGLYPDSLISGTNANRLWLYNDYELALYGSTIELMSSVNVSGTLHATTGIWSDGYVSAKGQNTSSDMRLKNVLNEVVLGVKDIANAPSMRFAWKNGGGVDVGSSAQYWQKLLPDAVKERNGMLEMQYANIALLSAIALAKNFETMDERVARLERENKELRTKIDMMERGIA